MNGAPRGVHELHQGVMSDKGTEPTTAAKLEVRESSGGIGVKQKNKSCKRQAELGYFTSQVEELVYAQVPLG